MPLFEYARMGTLDTIELPKHEVEAKEIALLGKREVSVAELEKEVVGAIEAVKGDFRQEQTVEAWKARFAEAKKGQISIYKAKVSCGSGFYVRQLVSDIGKDLGTGAVTLSILRTRVGEYLLSDSV
jgi:tRNA U55 pseudouridine synthase TruB